MENFLLRLNIDLCPLFLNFNTSDISQNKKTNKVGIVE